MILAPLILGLFCMAVILNERRKANERDADRVAHRRLLREIRRHE